jgi:hypothetical protein
MVLQTTFTTAGGTAVLTHALALGRNDRGHHLGAGSPGVLLRRLVCTSGEIRYGGQCGLDPGVGWRPSARTGVSTGCCAVTL